ncbi:unnamed protein product [Strongylus vulgaris]|uniref:Uncharacterized protein n=1 Tax=Strongylus vulgaris TaxID=40348 RepID=A0A3P7LCU1_STRVU|nr:unnamed protein product [Strongylus vulgaris]
MSPRSMGPPMSADSMASISTLSNVFSSLTKVRTRGHWKLNLLNKLDSGRDSAAWITNLPEELVKHAQQAYWTVIPKIFPIALIKEDRILH